jgi:hypothetical protein
MLQVIEKIRNWNLNREILLLQRDKLRQDVLQSGAKPAPISEEYVFQVNTRTEEAEYFLDRTARRLELGAVRVKELEIKVTTRLPTEE